MRLVLLLSALVSVAAPAYADGVRESRYGPTVQRQTAGGAARYDGPTLTWASRAQASSAAPAAPSSARPVPIAPWAAYQPVAASAPARTAAPLQPAAALPNSLYAAPRPPPAPAAPTAPQAQQVANLGGMPAGVIGARFYSVGRESGLTPDPIPPLMPDNRVLISAQTPPPAADNATPAHGAADWLAGGVDGNDDNQDSDGDRRAKTRNQDQ